MRKCGRSVPSVRPFRFGFQSITGDVAEVVRSARAAEAAGFDIFQVGDHVGTQLSPFVALAAAAAATSTIRIGTLVLNNDLRHPVAVAQEAATLDRVSDGRVELGLGAGHSFPEYQAIGMIFDPPAVRKARLSEAVEILRRLLDGHDVDYAGTHYQVTGARALRPVQQHLPLLVGVNGRTALARAAGLADTVALTMLGRTLEDGQHHEMRWEAERLDATIDVIRTAAQDRWPQLELHALVQTVLETATRARVADELNDQLAISASDVLATPFLCLGTTEEMAQHLLACRDRWGISYFTVRDIEAFAPAMALVRSLDGAGASNS